MCSIPDNKGQMATKIKDYIIYKISHRNPDIQYSYIGSTSNLKSRRYEHKHRCENDEHEKHFIKMYEVIRENGGWKDWVMNPIEELLNVTKTQAHIREQFYIDKIETKKLNSNNPHIATPEAGNTSWYARNRESRVAYCKIYNDTHKEEAKERRIIKRQKIKEEKEERQKQKAILDLGAVGPIN